MRLQPHFVRNSYGFDEKEIELTYEIEDKIELDINQAVPLALLVSELITNSYKHAFIENERGEIRVEAHEKANKVILRVIDSGKGVSPEEFENSESLGSQIIYSLADQLGAEL